jgi:hypothetical protein
MDAAPRHRFPTAADDIRAGWDWRLAAPVATTWMPGSSSWYLAADGFNASMYRGFTTQYLRQMRDFRYGDHHAVARDGHTGTVPRIRA